MLFLNLTYPDPAANLALDEALLSAAESGSLGESLRIWESPVYFVVLGYASKWKTETCEDYCRKNSVPILRRKSGGATVLQGPGCLNFSLVLHAHPQFGIRSDTRRIMECHLDAISRLELPGNFEIQGISDLTWNGKKFSGNAMRRGKNYFLFHGTFLYHFDLDRVSLALGHPDREPPYRAKRSHQDFLTNLPAKPKKIIELLKKKWQAHDQLKQPPIVEAEELIKNFYANSDWNLKF